MCATLAKARAARRRNPGYTRRLKTILAALDFSAVSGAVVAGAADLARATGGRVMLLTVVQPPVITSDYAPLMENISEITLSGERAAAQRHAEIEEQLKADSLAVESFQLTGAPVGQIVEQAQKNSADYVAPKLVRPHRACLNDFPPTRCFLKCRVVRWPTAQSQKPQPSLTLAEIRTPPGPRPDGHSILPFSGLRRVACRARENRSLTPPAAPAMHVTSP